MPNCEISTLYGQAKKNPVLLLTVYHHTFLSLQNVTHLKKKRKHKMVKLNGIRHTVLHSKQWQHLTQFHINVFKEDLS